MGWIGVDFDGTLSVYAGWGDGELGPPVPRMVERVRRWLADGHEVRVVTARVTAPESPDPQFRGEAAAFVEEQRLAIEQWCEVHLGQRLRVVAGKDYAMLELWDDRCVRVEPNTGRICDETGCLNLPTHGPA